MVQFINRQVQQITSSEPLTDQTRLQLAEYYRALGTLKEAEVALEPLLHAAKKQLLLPLLVLAAELPLLLLAAELTPASRLVPPAIC